MGIFANLFMTQYWIDPGPFNGAGLVKNVTADRFLGWISVLVQAAFSYQAMELVAMYDIHSLCR
jgi:yeast amino acid transporter